MDSNGCAVTNRQRIRKFVDLESYKVFDSGVGK